MPPRLARLPCLPLPGGLLVLVARAPPARALGLAGLASIPDGTGLLLPRCRSVHTLGMRFPLDLLWLDDAGALVRLDRAVPPGRLRTCRSARSVLETRAGAAHPFLAALPLL